MTVRLIVAALALIAAGATALRAQHAGHGGGHQPPSGPGHAAQPYAGQQDRTVSMLSDADIADLMAGRGWGLAKPAELNGFPGPAHVLELARELGLTEAQRLAVEAAFRRMQARAAAEGAAYVAAERAVDEAFRSGSVAAGRLAQLVEAAEQRRAAVRLAHLEAHLEVTPLLSAEQRRRYSELRGYATHKH